MEAGGKKLDILSEVHKGGKKLDILSEVHKGGKKLDILSEMHKGEFSYFYNGDVGEFAFYRIPKILFTSPRFKNVSFEAKSLYGLFLDRMCLSAKNGWLDKDKRVYIIYTIEEICEVLGIGKDKARRLIYELDTENGCGLIERKQQGLCKPSIIFVRNFNGEVADIGVENSEGVENSVEKSVENSPVRDAVSEMPLSEERKTRKAGERKIRLQDCDKSAANNTDINNTEKIIQTGSNIEYARAADAAITKSCLPASQSFGDLFNISTDKTNEVTDTPLFNGIYRYRASPIYNRAKLISSQ